MNSGFLIWLVQCIVVLFAHSVVVQGTPIDSLQHPARAPLQSPPRSFLVAPDILGLRVPKSSLEASVPFASLPAVSTTSTSPGISIPSTLTSSISVAVSSTSTPTSLTSSTPLTGSSKHTLSGTSTNIIISASSISETNLPHSTTRATSSSSSIQSDVTSPTTSPSPSTTSQPSSSSSDRRTLIIALSVTFSILGIIFILLVTILILQCSKRTSHYERFRLRNFPFSRGGATPLSDNEIASWREKPNLSPAGLTSPAPYTNLIQRYSRPLSLTRPLTNLTSQTSLSQDPRLSRYSGYGSGLIRPAVPSKLILTGGNDIKNRKRDNSHYSKTNSIDEINGISVTSIRDKNKEREKTSTVPTVLLPPIARAPNSRPGLTDESLPGTPAFILPTHPRRVSRKLSKLHRDHGYSNVGSITSPNTPRPSTSGLRNISRNGGVVRRSSMPGLNQRFYSSHSPGVRPRVGSEKENEWANRRCEEVDQVVQKGVLGQCDGHSRSRSDMTPFKEAMESRNRPSFGGVRPSFEESIGRVRGEAGVQV